MKKPRFDLSELRGSDSLAKCKDFLPKLQESNDKLTQTISEGDRSCIIDSDIRVYRGSHCPESVTGDDGDIVLDVGVGVFDVNNAPADESSLKASGVTTVSLDSNSEVFRGAEALITEIDSRHNIAL
ncbi:uncharacterized protein BXIN_0147 [Babesia sp. Xinjiang]|uniref:uncharacterized protein n=1 Tax=Babesia sp. Xinjiang TaxID=462227 RepID=UPI000A2462F6|nr:uncharacterized protein BXIN_0147 [Babesia sp. Xinjiang]ORM39779.1 hypothetical protein BXIN_0147 [Babesia sp. Xinjiang]